MKRLMGCLIILVMMGMMICTAGAETLGFGFVNSTDVALRRGVGGKLITRLPKDTCVWINDSRMDGDGVLWYEISAGLNIDHANYDFSGWMMAAFIDAGEKVWHDVTAMAAGNHGLIALRADGSTETAGRPIVAMDGSRWVTPKGWTAPYGRAIRVGVPAAGNEYFIVTERNEFVSSVNGMRVADGVAKAAAMEAADGRAGEEAAWLAEWRDVTDICVRDRFVLGLRKDGTAALTILRDGVSLDVSGWQDVVAIDAGHDWCVGLKEDGTLVFAGEHVFMNEGHRRK